MTRVDMSRSLVRQKSRATRRTASSSEKVSWESVVFRSQQPRWPVASSSRPSLRSTAYRTRARTVASMTHLTDYLYPHPFQNKSRCRSCTTGGEDRRWWWADDGQGGQHREKRWTAHCAPIASLRVRIRAPRVGEEHAPIGGCAGSPLVSPSSSAYLDAPVREQSHDALPRRWRLWRSSGKKESRSRSHW